MMRTQKVTLDADVSVHSVYLAGQRVPPGTYRQLEGGREVRLYQEDVLPATCDGRVAAYLRCPETWGERQRRASA